MSVYIGVRMQGLRQEIRRLEALGVAVSDLKKVFGDIADDAAHLAASLAPVRTGRLRRSIRGSRSKNKAVVRAGRVAVPYAGPINYGWPSRNIAPSHFLQRAEAIIRPTIKARVEHELDVLFQALP